jgi:hypothetical protein
VNSVNWKEGRREGSEAGVGGEGGRRGDPVLLLEGVWGKQGSWREL